MTPEEKVNINFIHNNIKNNKNRISDESFKKTRMKLRSYLEQIEEQRGMKIMGFGFDGKREPCLTEVKM